MTRGSLMICPSCGAHIADDTQVCPACHANLQKSLDQTDVLFAATFCPSCGARVPEDAKRCVKCGMSITHPKPASEPHKESEQLQESLQDQEALCTSDVDDIDQNISEEEDMSVLDGQDITNVMPRLVSAIPSEQDIRHGTYNHDHLPRTRVFVVAALAAIVFVGGFAYFMFRPQQNTDANTSQDTQQQEQQTAPEVLTQLQGQDSSGQQQTQLTDQNVYDNLMSVYTKTFEINEKLSASSRNLYGIWATTDREARQAGKNDIDAIQKDIDAQSTVLNSLSNASLYKNDIQHMKTLISYLNARALALSQAWQKDATSEAPTKEKAQIFKTMNAMGAQAGTDKYNDKFSENYEAYKPQPRGSAQAH